MSLLGIALDARAHIAKGWTQPTGPSKAEQCRARLEDGTPCSHLNPKATRFSLSGAVLRACNDDGGEHPRDPRAVALFAELRQHLGSEPSEWANAAAGGTRKFWPRWMRSSPSFEGSRLERLEALRRRRL